jgi:hypothetical protein
LLLHAAWGWHFLPIIMDVDSIPGLKERPTSRVSSGRFRPAPGKRSPVTALQ